MEVEVETVSFCRLQLKCLVGFAYLKGSTIVDICVVKRFTIALHCKDGPAEPLGDLEGVHSGRLQVIKLRLQLLHALAAKDTLLHKPPPTTARRKSFF